MHKLMPLRNQRINHVQGRCFPDIIGVWFKSQSPHTKSTAIEWVVELTRRCVPGRFVSIAGVLDKTE